MKNSRKLCSKTVISDNINHSLTNELWYFYSLHCLIYNTWALWAEWLIYFYTAAPNLFHICLSQESVWEGERAQWHTAKWYMKECPHLLYPARNKTYVAVRLVTWIFLFSLFFTWFPVIVARSTAIARTIQRGFSQMVLPLVFSLAVCATYSYSLYYDVNYQPRLGHEWYIYKLVMLTNLNFVRYFLICQGNWIITSR